MHAQRDHAKYLKEEKHVDYIFQIKGNQKTILEDIKVVDDWDFPPKYTVYDKGHGRIETRTIQTSTVLKGYTDFPYLEQVFEIDRVSTDLNGENKSEEINYYTTSLFPEEADAPALLNLTRGHWQIENSLHWVRDVTFDEDRSQIRTGNGPRVMATLRNLAISVFRLNGFDNIAKAIRTFSRKMDRSLQLVGLL